MKKNTKNPSRIKNPQDDLKGFIFARKIRLRCIERNKKNNELYAEHRKRFNELSTKVLDIKAKILNLKEESRQKEVLLYKKNSDYNKTTSVETRFLELPLELVFCILAYFSDDKCRIFTLFFFLNSELMERMLVEDLRNHSTLSKTSYKVLLLGAQRLLSQNLFSELCYEFIKNNKNRMLPGGNDSLILIDNHKGLLPVHCLMTFKMDSLVAAAWLAAGHKKNSLIYKKCCEFYKCMPKAETHDVEFEMSVFGLHRYLEKYLKQLKDSDEGMRIDALQCIAASANRLSQKEIEKIHSKLEIFSDKEKEKDVKEAAYKARAALIVELPLEAIKECLSVFEIELRKQISSGLLSREEVFLKRAVISTLLSRASSEEKAICIREEVWRWFGDVAFNKVVYLFSSLEHVFETSLLNFPPQDSIAYIKMLAGCRKRKERSKQYDTARYCINSVFKKSPSKEECLALVLSWFKLGEDSTFFLEEALSGVHVLLSSISSEEQVMMLLPYCIAPLLALNGKVTNANLVVVSPALFAKLPAEKAEKEAIALMQKKLSVGTQPVDFAPHIMEFPIFIRSFAPCLSEGAMRKYNLIGNIIAWLKAYWSISIDDRIRSSIRAAFIALLYQLPTEKAEKEAMDLVKEAMDVIRVFESEEDSQYKRDTYNCDFIIDVARYIVSDEGVKQTIKKIKPLLTRTYEGLPLICPSRAKKIMADKFARIILQLSPHITSKKFREEVLKFILSFPPTSNSLNVLCRVLIVFFSSISPEESSKYAGYILILFEKTRVLALEVQHPCCDLVIRICSVIVALFRNIKSIEAKTIDAIAKYIDGYCRPYIATGCVAAYLMQGVCRALSALKRHLSTKDRIFFARKIQLLLRSSWITGRASSGKEISIIRGVAAYTISHLLSGLPLEKGIDNSNMILTKDETERYFYILSQFNSMPKNLVLRHVLEQCLDKVSIKGLLNKTLFDMRVFTLCKKLMSGKLDKTSREIVGIINSWKAENSADLEKNASVTQAKSSFFAAEDKMQFLDEIVICMEELNDSQKEALSLPLKFI